MAIDLPPVMPPALVELNTMEYLRETSPGIYLAGAIGRFNIEVIDLPYLEKDTVRKLLEVSETPSQFIRSLNKAFRRNGNLLVQILYRQHENTVFIYALQTRLKNLEGPESVTKHFVELSGEKDLTTGEFDRLRILADMKAQRQGVDYSISYQLSDDYSHTSMVFDPLKSQEADFNHFYLDLGNQGSRYVGRYFGGAGWNHWFKSGLELKLDYQTALIDWGEADGGKDYEAGFIEFNYPSSFGLYGLKGLHSSYARELTVSELVSTSPLDEQLVESCPFPQSPLCQAATQDPLTTTTSEQTLLDIEAETNSVQTTGEQILISNVRHRLSFLQELEWIDDEIMDKQQGTILDERYGSASLGAKYLIRSSEKNRQARTLLQLIVKSGFGKDDGTLESDSTEGIVSIGKRTARFLLLKPNFSAFLDLTRHIRVGLDLSGQLSDGDQVPQMQQYVLGGISQLSAYLPGVLVGDSGAYGKFSISGTGQGDSAFKIIPSIFIEGGTSWFENATGVFSDTRSVADAGIRLLIKAGSVYQLEMVAARSFNEENLSEEYLESFEADFFARMRVNF